MKPGSHLPRHKPRWAWKFSTRRFDLCCPHGPRDYPFFPGWSGWLYGSELGEWLYPRLWMRFGSEGWPCFQLLIWRFYLRYWWGEWRWSAKEMKMVLVQ